MARWCRQCNRPLDAEGHNILDEPSFIIEKRKVRKCRRYQCKVRLVATNPATQETFVPGTPQRLAAIDTRFVHEDRFQRDLKPA